MKLYRFLFCIFVGLLVCGCAAFYGNEAQYKDGDWYLFTGSQEVARIRQDKLAIDKLNSRPPPNGGKGRSLSRLSRGGCQPEPVRYL